MAMVPEEGGTKLPGGIDTERTMLGITAYAVPARPYPGLRPFKVSEWPVFFGREVMAAAVLGRLQKRRMVVVHGASGCGKSSLIFAGVLPQLARRARQRRHDQKLAEMRPGRAPLRTLAEALATGCGIDDVDALHRAVARGRGAAAELDRLLCAHGVDRVCLYVDQFEELFRFAQLGSAEEATLFTEVLIGIFGGMPHEDRWWEPDAGVPPFGTEERRADRIRLLVSMRSEFLADCARFPGFAEVVNETQYLLPGMTRADLLRSIREPAEMFDGHVELALAERLADEAAGEADPLPLVQHALMRLWQAGPEMTLARYEAAIGSGVGSGLGRLLAGHAEEVLERSGGTDGAAAEQLFRALTDLDPAGRAIRRPQRMDRLLTLVAADEQDAMRAAIDGFRAENVAFLRPNADESESPLADDQIVDISHEALLRAWPRIADATLDPVTGAPRGWLHREFEDGLVWRSLAVQARAFTDDPAACLDPATTGRRTTWYDAVGARPAWADRHLIVRRGLPPGEEPEWRQVDALMAASRRERVQHARRKRRYRVTLGALGGLLVVTLAGMTWSFRDAALREALVAETLTDEADVAEEAAQSRAKSERAEETAPAASAGETPAARDFVWIGSAADPKLATLAGGQPVPPATAEVGTSYRLISDMIVRAAPPGEDYALARGRGFLPGGSIVRLSAAPSAYARGQTQYWAQMEGPVVPFGIVYLQFGGGTDDAAGRTATRTAAQRVSQLLQTYGYTMPGEQRVSMGAGTCDVRFFHAADLRQAELLASNVQRVGKAGGLTGLCRPALKDLTRASRKTAEGTIELWMDLGGVGVASAGSAS